MLLRRLIYLVALALGCGALGYGLALRTAPGAWAPFPDAPPAAEAPAAAAPSGTSVDWTRATEADLVVAPVFVAAHRSGVEAALDTLVAIAGRDPEVQQNGHHWAHAVGRVAIGLEQNDPTVLASCRPLFQAGCYHGVLEGYLASVDEVDADALAGFCEAIERPGAPPIDARECAHGLGHGLIERFAYAFDDALESCDAFDDAALAEECHDGIFMQNLVMGQGLPGSVTEDGSEAAGGHAHAAGGAEGAHEGAGFRADELGFPCITVDEPYQDSCWSYQPVAIRQFTGDAGPRTMMACDLAAESARERCYAGYGKQTLGRFDNDQDVLIEICSLAVPPYDYACLGGVVELLIDREWGPVNAIGFCGRVAAAGRDPSACWNTLGERIALLHPGPEETRTVCARAEDERLVAACTEGAGG